MTDAVSIPCPRCGAPAGSPCRAIRRGVLTVLPQVHPARRAAVAEARRAVSGVSIYAQIDTNILKGPHTRIKGGKPQPII